MKNLFTILLLLFILAWTNVNAVGWTGSGTSGDPYQISTAAHLALLATNVNGGTAYAGIYFKLMNDISLSGYPSWTPIGNVISLVAGTGTPFSGNFDGNNKTISGLIIAVSATTTQIGFGVFGYVGAAGVVSNLNVSGVSITFSIESKRYVGGLVGANQGTVDGCSSSGNLSNANSGVESIGGLVGENFGVASVVKNSQSSVNVTGGSYAGGLVGMNYGTVDNSYASGTITGVGRIGGLVGRNQSVSPTERGVVTNSYSTGNVTGSGTYVGGFIGHNSFYYIGQVLGYVENCYSTGTVTATAIAPTAPNVGGFVGYNYVRYSRAATDPNPGAVDIKGYIKNCYASGAVISAGEAAGGFVGYNYYNYAQALEPVPADLKLFGHLQQCYSTGDVTGTGVRVGGFVGLYRGDYANATVPADRTAAGILQDCYSWGNVIMASGGTPTSIGGFCGSSSYIINRCYSKGSVTYADGNNPTDKGFLGLRVILSTSPNQMDGNFWDIGTSGQLDNAVTGATGKTTAEMKSITTYEDAGWDFADETTNGTDNYWWMDATAYNGYPFLLWQPYTPSAPATQSSALTFSALMGNQMTVNWTKGNGTKRVVFAKQASSGTTVPTNSTTYTGNAAFGEGTQISPGWFCVYKGGESSATITGLSSTSDYIFQVFDYNNFSTNEIYNTSVATNNPKSQATTLAIEVTATEGTQAGSYSTLKAAFDQINLGTHKGAIHVKVKGSSIEAASCVLNASGTSGSSYTSIIIYPTAAGLTISGSPNAPLIDLNGADNVTIDGRVNATGTGKDLVISNTSNSNSPGTSTIRFINDASANNVKYCTVKGSSTASTGGILFFSTATVEGNDGNTIDNNNITNALDTNRPVNVAYSIGSTGFDNSGNTISNNNIYDFLNRDMTSYGISLGNYTTAWTISGNSFYETASFAPTASRTYRVINIDNLSGVNFTVSNNFIGGSSPLCAGTAWTKTTGASPFYGNTFYAVYLNVGTGTASNVMGNTIKNFTYSNSVAQAWYGINIAAGDVNIGATDAGNTIGEATGSGSITFTAGASNTFFYSINATSSGTLSIQNNTIASITVANAPTLATHFYGIISGGAGTATISNNTIGSTDAGTTTSINASSASTGNEQNVRGIIYNGTGIVSITGNTVSKLTNSTTHATAGSITGIRLQGGSYTVSNNLVRDLSIACLNTFQDYKLPIAGILVKIATTGNQTVSNNTVYNLSNTNPSNTGAVVGLYYEATTSGSNTGTVSGNFIHSLSVDPGTNATVLQGIRYLSGAVTFSNNVIFLGGNTSTEMYGIMMVASTNAVKFYHNTVYISGNPTTGDRPSFSFSSYTSNTRNIRNNLFINARSNSGGATGKHYAISLINTTKLVVDYNDYYVSGAGGVIGMFNDVDKSTLVLWRSATTQDVSSINTTPSFINPGGTSAQSYTPLPPVSLPGTPIDEVTTDFAARTRAATPTMGAFEAVSPITVEATAGTATGGYTTLKAAFDKINDGTHKGYITIKLNANTSTAGITETATAVLNASGTGTSPNISNIDSVLIYPTITGIVLTGSISSNPIIKLSGSNHVTIDGSVNATGTIKDLTITNTSATTPRVIMVGSSGTTPVTDVTVKNCMVINGVNTGTAISVSDVTDPTSAGYFNNITFQNNSVQKANYGIYALAAVASGNGSGLLIKENEMTASGANAIRRCAIYTEGVDGATVSNNTIANMATSDAISPVAIWFNAGTNSGTISGNTISNLSLTNTGAHAVTGIVANSGASATAINITGNTVQNLMNSGASYSFAGIYSTSPNTNITDNVVTGLTQNGTRSESTRLNSSH